MLANTNVDLGLQTHSATRLFGPERQREPLTGAETLSDGPPRPGTRQQRPRPTAAPTPLTSGSPAQTGAYARRSSPAKAPGRRITLGELTSRGAPLPRKAGIASRRGAELTRSACLEPAGRQLQAAPAAQRHWEPVPATASGGSHLPPLRGSWAPPS